MADVTSEQIVKLNIAEGSNGKEKSVSYGGSELDNINESSTTPYDPHVHRVLEHPTNNRETLIHLLKGSLGTGILAMPNAFLNAGLLVGTVGTFFIGFLCTYCLHVLVRSQYELCKSLRVPILSYPDSMKYALKQGPSFLKFLVPLSAPIVDGFLIVYQLGICCVYIVFIGDTLKQVLDEWWVELPIEVYMLSILMPLILITLIRNLKLLAPFSQLANIITFFALGIILYYVLKSFPPVSSVPLYGEPRNYTLFIGTTLFALEAVGVVLALENNMETPKSFGGYGGVLNQGMTLITILYVLMGFLGYVKYGENVKSSITLSLPKTPLAQTVNLILAIAIFITFALQCYVPVDIIWNTYLKKHISKRENTVKKEYMLRVTLVILTFLLAISIPYLGLFISLFGALCLSVLGIAFPALIEICILWPNKFGVGYYVLIKDIILIIIGILAGVLGTYIAVQDIITEVRKRISNV